jgi:YVTN family beta-propeller protein
MPRPPLTETLPGHAPWAWRPAMRRAGCWGLMLAGACAAAHAAPFAYITNQGSHDVSVIDLASQRVVATVPVGKSPAGVVAVGAAARVFVSSPDARTVSVIDMRSHKVVDTLQAGAGPVGIDASADGRRVFVADWYRNRLLVLDTSRGTEAPLEIEVGRAPAGVAVSADGRQVYVAERDDDSVAVIDLETRRVRARVKVGLHPFALLLDRRTAAPVRAQRAGRRRVGDRPAHARGQPHAEGRQGSLRRRAGPRRAPAVRDQPACRQVSVFDAQTLAPLRTLTGFGYPEGISAADDKVYVVNWMDDNVSVLDAESGRSLRRIDTGTNPRGFGAFIGAPATP